MDTRIKRGIDLQNRLWESSIGKRIQKNVRLWDGGPIDKFTFLGLFAVFFVNVFIVSAIVGKNISDSFSTSSFLMVVANVFQNIGITNNVFFVMLTVISLLLAPINIYLFVRKIVHRHELTAFLCAILYVVPNPLSPDGLPLVKALIGGDGAHAIIFSIIPLLLLYFKAFLNKGLFVWGFLSAIMTALVAVVSPFAAFNLLIFFIVITISEGFVGSFRLKITRFICVLLFAFGLSYFWYHPSALTKIVVLDGVRFAVSYLWRMFPILIPTIPTLGAISFLIFDRREKLQPVFIAIGFFVIYFMFYSISSAFNVTGIFMPERYRIELYFSMSLLGALTLGFLLEFVYHNTTDYLKHLVGSAYLLGFKVGIVIISIMLLAFVGFKVTTLRSDIETSRVIKAAAPGAGNIKREGFDAISLVADLVSLLTLVFMLYLLKQYPPKLTSKA